MAKKTDIMLFEVLTAKGLISLQEVEPLMAQAASSGMSLQQLLIKDGRLPEKDILKVLAESLRITCVDLKGMEIDKTVLSKVPMKIATYYKFVPLMIKDRTLSIAVAAPLEIKTQDEIRIQLGYSIECALAPQRDVVEALQKYYGLGAETIEGISSAALKEETSPRHETHTTVVEDIEKQAGDASVVKLVNQILLEGYRKRATDIHIEPQRNGVGLRYRIDGILYDSPVPPEIRNFLSAIISRIKIMSNLNIVERRLPQDGRAMAKVQDQTLDLRISTIPTPFGESVVIRILPTTMLFSLEKLGLSKREMQIFERLIQEPNGVIFVTGPTGNGKTTTLYTCLNRINTRDRKIITLEDPIEYEMAGITQIQVMPEIDFDFARGLRSILRHDPDVIMVGEVRDLETAETAIRVALTGHLVFSTLHTNDAASGIARLIDIGVEPYLLSTSVQAFIAQRLIRTICQDCKHEDKNAARELKEQIARDLGLKSMDEVKIFRGKGCSNCNQTGYWGRTGIYEILLVDERIRELILKKVSSDQIKKVAVAKGMHTLRQDGWLKVIAGATTPEEVVKTTSADDEDQEESPMTAEEPLARDNSQLEGIDRRDYPRLNSKVNIRFKVFNSLEGLLKSGYTPEQLSVTKDISAGGLQIISSQPLAIGGILELKIELPNEDEAIECLAKVLRTGESHDGQNYNVAVHYMDISSADKARLAQYVESEGR